MFRSDKRPKILAYYFPNYHFDPKNAKWFGDEWNEWQLVRSARPRFPGHRQPKVPALGYQDESDPAVMRTAIDLADSHGIDGFIFDYYWYENGPYLEAALSQGFLHAANEHRVEFSLMWANHDLLDIFPRRTMSDPPLLESGAVGRPAFERMAHHVVDDYFGHPAYTKIQGRPRFSVYEVGNLIRGLGGVDSAAEGLAWFDDLARGAGHPGVHFDAVTWGFAVLPAEVPVADTGALLGRLGFRSASSYVWIHHCDTSAAALPRDADWRRVTDEAFRAYDAYRRTLPVPFHPNVSCGWDGAPRLAEGLPVRREYPGPIWQAGVDDFKYGLELAREFVATSGYDYDEVTINAWNEWTEGSYLMPDEETGTGRLDAVLSVFGPRQARQLGGSATALTG